MGNKTSTGSVIITGASSGIGEACALRLDRRGFHVFAGVRRISDGELLQQKTSDRLVPVLLDVTSQESIASAKELISAQIHPAGLFGLFNNAGIPLGGALEALDLDDFRSQMEVNLIGAIAMTQAFLPLLRKGNGRIINMSSISGLIALPFVGPYAATKFALEAISDSLRVELKPWGISVSLVEAGAAQLGKPRRLQEAGRCAGAG